MRTEPETQQKNRNKNYVFSREKNIHINRVLATSVYELTA